MRFLIIIHGRPAPRKNKYCLVRNTVGRGAKRERPEPTSDDDLQPPWNRLAIRVGGGGGGGGERAS